jgi:hypothetical protein
MWTLGLALMVIALVVTLLFVEVTATPEKIPYLERQRLSVHRLESLALAPIGTTDRSSSRGKNAIFP